MNEKESSTGKKVIVGSIWAAAVIILFVGLRMYVVSWFENHNNPEGSKEDVQEDNIQADAHAGKVAALINGEPVLVSELDEGLPLTTSGRKLALVRDKRLSRLVRNIGVKQFLAKHGVTVPDNVVEQAIEEYSEIPPPLSCGCCRAKSLGQYLELNYMTLNEFKRQIKMEKGLDIYLEDLWKNKKEAVLRSLSEDEIKRIKDRHAKAYHIFFNAFQDPDYRNDPENVFKKKTAQAEETYNRLTKGETIEKLVKEKSEDEITKDREGFLGYCRKGADPMITKKFTDTLFKLKPGSYSKPVITVYGAHVIFRKELTDEDIQNINEFRFKEKERKEIIEEIKQNIKIKVLTNSANR